MNHSHLLLMFAMLGLILILGMNAYLDHKRNHADFMLKLKQYQADMVALDSAGKEHTDP